MDTPLIDLAGFRRKYGIKQTELASFLGTTRGYISIVESGKAKLSAKSIDMILQHWGACGLVPCYDRLSQLQLDLKVLGRLEFDIDTMDLSLPFEQILSKEVVESIKYGKNGISDEIANKIISYFPTVNKSWLVSGEGDMFYNDYQLSFRVIEDRIDTIEKKIDLILSKLDSISDKHDA